MDDVLKVYNDDLTVGYVYEFEKTNEYDPEYMGDEQWCFSSTHESNNHNYKGLGCCGSWNKLSLLLFVENHDEKIKFITDYLSNTDKTKIELNEITTILAKR